MADFIAKKLKGELSYETPRILEMTIPSGIVRGLDGSGNEFGNLDGGDDVVVPGELVTD